MTRQVCAEPGEEAPVLYGIEIEVTFVELLKSIALFDFTPIESAYYRGQLKASDLEAAPPLTEERIAALPVSVRESL